MTKDRKMPEEFQRIYERSMQFAPPELREDSQFQRSSLVYLKLGGERLLRQHIEVVTKPFCDPFDIGRRRPEIDVEEDGDTETADDEKDDDDDDDGDDASSEDFDDD